MAENITVRFAQERDVDWCMYTGGMTSDEFVKRKVDLKEIVVAEIGGSPVGYLQFDYLWPGYRFSVPLISFINVLKEHQRRGVGRSILGFLERHLHRKGYKLLLSSSQVNESDPQEWHRHMGFYECGFLAGVNFEDGLGEVFFCKSLT